MRRVFKLLKYVLLLGVLYAIAFKVAQIPLVVNSGNGDPLYIDRVPPSVIFKKQMGLNGFEWLDHLLVTEQKARLDLYDGLRNACVFAAYAYVRILTGVVVRLGMAVAVFFHGIWTLDITSAIFGPIFMLLFTAIEMIGIPLASFIVWLGLAFQEATTGYYCIYVPFGFIAFAIAASTAASAPIFLIIILRR